MVRFTSSVGGHRHVWRFGVFLSSLVGHCHRLDFVNLLALPVVKGGHQHRLLMKERKKR